MGGDWRGKWSHPQTLSECGRASEFVDECSSLSTCAVANVASVRYPRSPIAASSGPGRRRQRRSCRRTSSDGSSPILRSPPVDSPPDHQATRTACAARRLVRPIAAPRQRGVLGCRLPTSTVPHFALVYVVTLPFAGRGRCLRAKTSVLELLDIHTVSQLLTGTGCTKPPSEVSIKSRPAQIAGSVGGSSWQVSHHSHTSRETSEVEFPLASA
jgi:hypothetical protein